MARGSSVIPVALLFVTSVGVLAHAHMQGWLDDQPPDLEARVVATTQEEARLHLVATDPQGLTRLRARWRGDWREVEPGTITLSTAGLPPGWHPVEIEALDASWSLNEACATAWIRVDPAPPPPPGVLP